MILTASGGPFRTRTIDQLTQVSVSEALAHPTWDMGPKVTIDSATLMNKALEIIEARWLFNISSEKIAVMIHPQSIVHSMVEFVDGSVIAQLSPPDMKLPIQYALTWPDAAAEWRRGSIGGRRCTWILNHPISSDSALWSLDWKLPAWAAHREPSSTEPTRRRSRPFLAIGWGSARSCLFAARVLRNHNYDPNPTLADVLAMDRWARQEVLRWIAA